MNKMTCSKVCDTVCAREYPARHSDTCWMDINVHAITRASDWSWRTYMRWKLSMEEGRSSPAFTVPTLMAEYIESNSSPTSSSGEKVITDIDDEKQLGIFRKVTQFLLRWGIETHGWVIINETLLPFDRYTLSTESAPFPSRKESTNVPISCLLSGFRPISTSCRSAVALVDLCSFL